MNQLHNGWLVDDRVRVRWTAQGGYTGTGGRIDFTANVSLELEPRFSQACAQVYQPGCNDQAIGIDGLVSGETVGLVTDGDDVAIGNTDSAGFDRFGHRVEYQAVGNQQATHGFSSAAAVSGSRPRTMDMTAMRTEIP